MFPKDEISEKLVEVAKMLAIRSYAMVPSCLAVNTVKKSMLAMYTLLSGNRRSVFNLQPGDCWQMNEGHPPIDFFDP